MGTDFSYDDMSLTSRDTDDDTHAFASPNTATVSGKECWVIVSTPKDKDYQYQKMVDYVGKSDSLMYKIELYKKAGDTTATKILELNNYSQDKSASGKVHNTPHNMKNTTVDAKTYTTITMTRVAYDMSDKQLPEGVFTTNFLQTGRP
jgi:hypothetical protein